MAIINMGQNLPFKPLCAQFIKEQVNPLDFYRNELGKLTLKKQDWNIGGLCPFHTDNRPGSFYFNTTTGAFNCFSCGASGGDIVAFVMLCYQLTFIEALKKISMEWGV